MLHQESQSTAKIMNIGLHPHVSGRAYRIRALREFIEEVLKHNDIWRPSRSEIVDSYLDQADKHIQK